MEDSYPDLTKMCRLCLQENAGVVPIFPTADGHKLSLSVRIMAVVAQEVSNTDELPKFLCRECRYQLEKSYVFRKRAQQADNKLRSHLRLINVGRKSSVFVKNEENEYMMDELEFEESLCFIKQHETERAALERELLKQTLLSEIDEEQMRAELRTVLREEVIEECRRVERTSLLNDLESYLGKKRLADNHVESVRKKQRANSHSPNKLCQTSNNVIARTNTVPEASFVLEDGVIDRNDDSDDDDVPGHMSDNDNFVDHDEDSKFYLLGADNDGAARSEDANASVKVDNTSYFAHNDNDSIQMPKPLEKSTSYQIENFKIELNQPTTVAHDRTVNKKDNVMVFNIEQNEENGQMDMVKLITLDPDVILRSPNTKEEITNDNKTLSNGIADDSVKEIISCTEFSKLLEVKLDVHDVIMPVVDETGKKIATHTSDTLKTFKCTVCPKEFSTEHSLMRHIRAHRTAEEKGISFQCTECQIFLSCKSALSRHMITHTGEKPYTCHICDKSFVQREILTRHMHIHTGNRPHKCPHCTRTFTQRMNLTHHINNTHMSGTNTQTHSCHLCPKRFSHASGLSRHLLQHSGIAYYCNGCNRQFGDRSSVKRHILNVHNIVESDEINKYISKAKDNEVMLQHLKVSYSK